MKYFLKRFLLLIRIFTNIITYFIKLYSFNNIFNI